MPSLARMFRDRTDNAFNAAVSIEAKIKTVIPELQAVAPVLGKSDVKMEAVIATLREVTELAADVKSEIEASRSHLDEGTEALKEIQEQVDEHRRDMAHVTTFARNFKVFLQDPVYLKEIITMVGLEVVKEVLREIESA